MIRLHKDWYEGVLKFNGKEYPISIVKGIRYIDGKTINQFMETLSSEEMINFAKVGLMTLKKELKEK